MCAFIDRTGIKYGRLTVIKLHEIVKKKGSFWLCKCDCGNEKIIRGNMLGKQTRSCGCLKKEMEKENLGRFINGKMQSRLATIWYHMKSRCYNENDTNYKNYGAKGITVCEEWLNDFENFEKWSVLNGYSDNLSIDRIEVEGNYEPANCRWADFTIQSNNKRNTLFVEYNNQIMSLKQAYNLVKPQIAYQTAKTRYHNGERNIDELFIKKRKYRGN